MRSFNKSENNTLTVSKKTSATHKTPLKNRETEFVDEIDVKNVTKRYYK